MNSIQPIGSFFPTDTTGYILNPCLLPPFGAAWDFMLDEICAFLLKKFPGQIHSIWLRGSVARGKGIAGKSDLDTFALVRGEGLRWHELPELHALKARLEPFGEKYFPLECQLESYPGKPEQLRPQIAMLIATQSVCIWGENLRPLLGKYRPGKALMLDYRWISSDVKACLQKMDQGENLDKEEFCSLMKSFIRAGFECVMEQDGRYTRDLYPAYQAFSSFYPEKEADMRKALFWFLNPMPDMAELQAYLTDFGLWLGEKCDSL